MNMVVVTLVSDKVDLLWIYYKLEHVTAISYMNLTNRVQSNMGGRESVVGRYLLVYGNKEWLHTTCTAAGLFFLQERFHFVGIVNPACATLAEPSKRYVAAASFGAFGRHRNYKKVADVLRLPGHLTAFIFTPSKKREEGDGEKQITVQDPELAGSDTGSQLLVRASSTMAKSATTRRLICYSRS